MKTYSVVITSRYPAHGERPAEHWIEASSANEAIKAARKIVLDSGRTRRDGPVHYKAKLISGNAPEELQGGRLSEWY